MSDTAADLFADDLLRIVMDRLSVRLQPSPGGDLKTVDVLLVDTKTGYCVLCAGPRLRLPTLVSSDAGLEYGTATYPDKTQF